MLLYTSSLALSRTELTFPLYSLFRTVAVFFVLIEGTYRNFNNISRFNLFILVKFQLSVKKFSFCSASPYLFVWCYKCWRSFQPIWRAERTTVVLVTCKLLVIWGERRKEIEKNNKHRVRAYSIKCFNIISTENFAYSRQ